MAASFWLLVLGIWFGQFGLNIWFSSPPPVISVLISGKICYRLLPGKETTKSCFFKIRPSFITRNLRPKNRIVAGDTHEEQHGEGEKKIRS